MGQSGRNCRLCSVEGILLNIWPIVRLTDGFDFITSSSSTGTTTLSWVSACSTVVEHSQQEGFTEWRCQRHVKPPTSRKTRDLERSNFRHKRPPAPEATLANPAAEGGIMGEKWPRLLPKVETSTSLLGSFSCRKARHGTDGFTSPPKEGVLRIFSPPKNPTASAGFETANLGTKGQHATSRPPKPRFITSYRLPYFKYPQTQLSGPA
jgi:hypothetical protein